MRRMSPLTIMVMAALLLVAAAAGCANPGPSYSSARTGYPVFVTSNYDSGADLWTYNVYVDPDYELMAFVVYSTNLTPTTPLSPVKELTGCSYSNTVGWTESSGGWGWHRGASPTGTSAAFGWRNNRPSGRIPGCGSVPAATFTAQNLPRGAYDLFTVHLAASNGLTFWARAQAGPPPPVVPEPGTLAASVALLAPGGISLMLWRFRHRR